MLLRTATQSLLASSSRARASPASSSFGALLAAFSQVSLGAGPSTSWTPSTSLQASSSRQPSHNFQQTRTKLTLTPRRSKYRKAFKGRVPVHTGGSTAGSTVEHGEYGLRVKSRPSRLSAKQLSSAHEALRRGIKVVKGAKVYLRVFPDIPVCIKGNETRMGKGKGTFEYWACRAPIGKVIFEVGGGGIAEQVAKDALQLAAAKLPVQTEFITRQSLPRLGNLVLPEHNKPANPSSLPGSSKRTGSVPAEELVQSTEVPTA